MPDTMRRRSSSLSTLLRTAMLAATLTVATPAPAAVSYTHLTLPTSDLV